MHRRLRLPPPYPAARRPGLTPLFLALLIAGSCASTSSSRSTGPGGHTFFSSSFNADGFRDHDGLLTFRKELPQDDGKVTAKVKLRVDEGEVSFRLSDPHGRTRWEHTVEPGAPFEDKDWFRGPEGEWRLELFFTRASGRYSVRLSAR